jgi:hypothetical protein
MSTRQAIFLAEFSVGTWMKLEEFRNKELNCTNLSAELRDQARKMTKIGAKVMKFHSGSSNMVPLRLAL